MVCIAPTAEGVVLVSHNPISVFTTTAEHIDRLKKKPDGHYNREDLLKLVKQGHAVMYDEKAVRAISQATDPHTRLPSLLEFDRGRHFAALLARTSAKIGAVRASTHGPLLNSRPGAGLN
jgi:hypothetical protein